MARKKVLVIATGGTIASAEGSEGLRPTLGGRELLGYVPEVSGLCDLDVVQPMNVDSTNMRPRDWLRMAACVREAYDSYDGFVVLHGTDTMAYSAAALSYLVQDSAKPIVLTGSQRPMASPFTDAKLNLYQSVVYACDDLSHDVSVVFGGQVIAGTRARKQRTMSDNAFTSVNFPVLALVRGDKVVRAGFAPELPAGSPRFYDRLDERVFVLKLTPEMRPDIFSLLRDDYRAVIVETFGMGGIPQYGDDPAWRGHGSGGVGGALGDGLTYERAMFDWVGSGRTLVLTTQVPEEGLDLGVYEVGRRYSDKPGILRGADMTTEALVAKTMWALGQAGDGAGADDLAALFYRPVNHDRAQ